MKIYNDFIIVSKDSSVDERDSTLSVFRIIDNFEFSLPSDQYKKFNEEQKTSIALLPTSYVINSSWHTLQTLKKDIEVSVLLEVTDPNGKVLGGSVEKAVFPKGTYKLRLNGAADSLPITVNGIYKLKMQLKDVDDEVLSERSTRVMITVKEEF